LIVLAGSLAIGLLTGGNPYVIILVFALMFYEFSIGLRDGKELILSQLHDEISNEQVQPDQSQS
jgi:hypothetical protein